MKLYRGIKADEVKLYTPSLHAKAWNLWPHILRKRAEGNFSYPAELDAEIQSLERLAKLTYQHFTDNKQIALSYAKRENGRHCSTNG